MAELIVEILSDFWLTLTAMAPYLLFGFLVAGIMSVFISPKFVENHLGGKGIWPVAKASLFGVPLPLCSCGVIPVTVSLRNHGASKGASISFLLSTPQTGVDSFFVTYSLLGPVLAIFRPIIAFITGIIGGMTVGLVAKEKDINKLAEETEPAPDENICQDPCCKDKNESKFVRLFKYGFITLPKDIGRAMLIGLIVAALIAAIVPEGFVIEGTEALGTVGTMLLMMVLGIPVYVCATASVPLAAVMIMKGIAPGAVLVFLMTGPATNAAAFATIWKSMGYKTALVYISTVIVCALGAGLALEWMFPELIVSVQEHFHEMEPGIFGHIMAVVLLIVLFYGIYMKMREGKE